MDFEEDFWKLVKDRGHVAPFYREECEALWTTYSPAQQKALCEAIKRKIDAGLFVSYRPNDAMRDNAPRTPKTQTLSYAEYYARFNTTDPINGWKKIFLPDQQKTIYVKN